MLQPNAQNKANASFRRLRDLFCPVVFVSAWPAHLVVALASAIFLSAIPPTQSVRSNAGSALLAGVSKPGSPIMFTCQLSAPASFDAEPLDSDSALLTWSPVSGAASYRLLVYRLDTNELISDTGHIGSQTQLDGLEEGVGYRCALAAICSSGSVSSFIVYEDVML